MSLFLYATKVHKKIHNLKAKVQLSIEMQSKNQKLLIQL